MPTDESPRWLPQARCHFEKIHESFWEKGELWRCTWCEEFLKEFHIKGTVENAPNQYWAVHKYTGYLWKIKGRESFRPGAWDVKGTLRNPLDFVKKA